MSTPRPGRVLVTGGAGFVGTNVVDRLLTGGHEVVVLDDLSRPGVEQNLAFLQAGHPSPTFIEGDIRDAETVRRALRGCAHVFHFAAQVAVTTSVVEPRADFGVNLAGTLNLLEEVRRMSRPPSVLFTSTNKVYGGLADLAVVDTGGRYEPADDDARTHGIGEGRPLDFCSPYGCSKGGADQYVLDYAKTYGLRAVVFRMSCIYGQHQQGNEDQGWVAHFLRQALHGEPITLYGDGLQVRDILHVDDLVDAMFRTMADIEGLSGRAFNIGGGPSNTVSLLELLGLIDALGGRRPEVSFEDWRVGDQHWYVSDTRAFSQATGWTAGVGVRAGVERLYRWLRSHERLAVAEAR
jgi:CDP-paratose 2-epimerase